jgi:hypothetical protein
VVNARAFAGGRRGGRCTVLLVQSLGLNLCLFESFLDLNPGVCRDLTNLVLA